MKTRNTIHFCKLTLALFLASGVYGGGGVLACEEEPGDLEIESVTGAQETDVEDYYIVVIPTGETPVEVTIVGKGDTPCPTDSEKCVCKGEKENPPTDGDPLYTFANTVGTQDPEGSATLKWSVTSSTEPGEYTFQVTQVEQKYGSCREGWTGGVASKTNTQASKVVTVAAIKVEIDKCAESFVPQGGQQDNEAQITARILPNSLKGKFTLTLTGVSNEPGFCMNAPLEVPGSGEDSASWKDLQFKDTQSGYTISGTNKETIKNDEDLNAVTVAVKSFDYGASGQLKAEVKIKNVTVTGYAKGEQDKDSIYIPQDDYESPNQIAESAEQNSGPGEGKAKADDTDDTPAGDGTDGDLLTRYEEYRGFMVNGAHARTSHTTKTIFVHDKTGHTVTDGGGGTLSLIPNSGLETKFLGDGEYVANNRRINANGGTSAQRAIVVEDANKTGGDWGRTNGPFKPSTYASCYIWLTKFTRQFELARAVPQNNIVVYYEPANMLSQDVWQANGRIKIGNSVISYTSGTVGVQRAHETVGLVAIPATSTSIVVGSSANNDLFGRYACVDNNNGEVFDRGSWISGKLSDTEGAIDAAVQTITTTGNIPTPPQGSYVYARIGTEWIQYTGVSGNTMTGVTRGALGSAAAPHADDVPILVPFQWVGCTRGALNTTAAAIPLNTVVRSVGVLEGVQNQDAHAKGATFGCFENLDDAVRQIAAHEAAHVFGMNHHQNCIMHTNPGMARGRYLNAQAPSVPIFNQYTDAAKGEINAR